MNTLKEIGEVLLKADGVLIFTHARPDGDAIGSAMALYRALSGLNIPAEVLDESDIPETFSFIPEIADTILKKPKHTEYGVYVAVDSADEFRFGNTLTEVFLAGRNKNKITVNIDHHISNTKFAKYNYVAERSSNCENMLGLLSEMGVKITAEIARYLLLGMITDSGTFTHSDVTPSTLDTAAFLIRSGASIHDIDYNMFKKQPMRKSKLYRRALNNLRFALNDRLGMVIVRLEDFDICGAKQEDTEGFVDYPLTIDTVEVSVAFMEVRKDQYKISLRSKGKANVNAVASVYGGGGHVLASGCTMHGDIEEIIDKMTYTVKQHLTDDV